MKTFQKEYIVFHYVNRFLTTELLTTVTMLDVKYQTMKVASTLYQLQKLNLHLQI